MSARLRTILNPAEDSRTFVIGWFDEPRLHDLAPVVERLAEA